jgi:hypothetical protein
MLRLRPAAARYIEGRALIVENECNTSFLTFFHRHGTELRGQQQHKPAEPLRTVRYVSLIPIASIVCCVLHHLSLIHGRVSIVMLCEHAGSAIRLSVPVLRLCPG